MALRDVPVHPAGEFRPQPPGRHALEAFHQRGDGYLGRVFDEQVHVVVFPVELAHLGAEIAADLPHGILAAPQHVRVERAAPVFRHEDQMNVERGNHMPAMAVIPGECHRPRVGFRVMQVRYRYRLPRSGRQAGIDLGLASLVVTSDGEVVPNPRFLRKKQRRLARAQRALSRKQNILAAGRADKSNACGGQVRPAPVLAPAGEAGTLRGAA